MKRMRKNSFTAILMFAILNFVSFSLQANWQDEWNEEQTGIEAFEKAMAYEVGCKCKDKKKTKSEE